jgi:hypothetical protein
MSAKEDITLSETSSQPAPTEVRLVDVSVKDENTALNVMVGFLTLAQREGHLVLTNPQKFGNA